MKKLGIVLLVACVVVLAMVTGNLYSQINEKELVAQEQQNEMQKLENEIAELENKIAQAEKVLSQEDEPLDEVEFDSNKMKVKADNFKYTQSDVPFDISYGLQIEIKEGKAYLTTTNMDKETIKSFSDLKITDVEQQEITEFDSKIKEYYCVSYGNGDGLPTIYFLMENGTVEYIESAKMLENEEYKSQGKVGDLKNIVKIIQASTAEITEDGEEAPGYSTLIALDEDGYGYDLKEVF